MPDWSYGVGNVFVGTAKGTDKLLYIEPRLIARVKTEISGSKSMTEVRNRG